jgi:2-C-methyl-D-erythritol 4-phosphate cytidylyltransferase
MNIVIVAAAGQGRRMGGARAKQFLELAGIPVLIQTLRRFEQCETIGQAVVVIPNDEIAGFLSLVEHYPLAKLSRVIPGGASRAESVWRGFQSLRAATAEIVAVHDGVRPLVTPAEIDETVRTAARCGAAILVAPVTDTIKQVQEGQITGTIDRAQLRRALTPQCFKYELLRRAFEDAGTLDERFTDESALVERLGVTVATVEGSSRNIKITRPEDLAFAEFMLKAEKGETKKSSSKSR